MRTLRRVATLKQQCIPINTDTKTATKPGLVNFKLDAQAQTEKGETELRYNETELCKMNAKSHDKNLTELRHWYGTQEPCVLTHIAP
jgi:hypothetical protein